MARLLFLQNHHYEFLGPMYISAVAKRAGHDCRLLAGEAPEDFSDTIDRFKPDFIGFSVMTGGHHWVLETARHLKGRYPAKIVLGGPHPTFYPDIVKDEAVDYLVRGEGEGAVLDLLNNHDAGISPEGIPNLVFKKAGQVVANHLRNLISDLDSLPFPDRDLYACLEKRVDRSLPFVISARGCPFSCAFCFEESMRGLYRGKGKFVRFRDVRTVVEECLELKRHHRARMIYFVDDVFGIDKHWLFEFLDSYRNEVGLPFVCLLHAKLLAEDENIARKLSEAGCHSVFFGIETANERIRNELIGKNLEDSEIFKAAEFLHRWGIRFRTYNMFGLPDETLEDSFRTIELNIRIGTDFPWCSIFTPYPQTGLADYSKARGYLDPDFDEVSISQSFFVSSKLRLKDISRMENLQKFFQTAVLFPWTLPLIRLLIRLPANALFTGWFGFVYFIVYCRSEARNFLRTFRFAVSSYKRVLK